MTFDEAERKFRELQARVQRGEPISRADYEAMVAELAVQDDRGVLWEINPRTGKWMYFDGAEWVVGRPPGRDQSTVIPVSQAMTPPPGATPPPMPRSNLAPPPTGGTPLPMPVPGTQPRPSGVTPPPTPKSAFTPAPQPRPAGATPQPQPRPGAAAPSAQMAAPPPESVQEGPGVGGVQRTRMTSPFGGGGNREWIPLAIAAVVLLFCAVVIFAVAIFNGGSLFGGGATRTPTRVAIRTSTPLPPTVALPSPTALPPTAVPVTAKVTATTGNVRAAPKTGKIITTLKKNAEVTLIARSEDNLWFQINVAGQPQPGWIALEVLQITTGDPKTLPLAGGSATPTPTKQALAPPPIPAALSSATPTVIGAPTQTPTPTATPKP